MKNMHPTRILQPSCGMIVIGLLLSGFSGCGPSPDASSPTSQDTREEATAGETFESGESSEAEAHPSTAAETTTATETTTAAETGGAKTIPIDPAALKPAALKVDPAVFLDDALNGKLEAIQLAIQSGIDVDTADDQQRTALLLAAFNGHSAIIRLLLDNGANLRQRDAMGRTALMFAATGDNATAVEILLAAKADVNAVDSNEGFTALMHAAAEGQADVVKVLLRYKADTTLRDIDGDSALDFAAQNRHIEVMKLLPR